MVRLAILSRLSHRFTVNPYKRTLHVTATRLTQDTMAASVNLHTILNENTTDRYTIEYDGFMSNHISHALIALERLGASPNRLERFVKWYRPRLEYPTDADKTEIVESETIPSLRGKEISFYAILRHYENLMNNKYGSLEKIVAAEFPKLSTGIAGAAFHGAIQLGYSYTVKHQRSILEALAYLHFAYRPVTSKTDESWSKKFGHGDTDIIDVFTAICNDKPLRDDMLVGEKQDPRNDKKTGTFQKRTDYLLTKRGDALIDYAKSIKLPESVFENGAIDPIKLSKQILEWAITVYALSEVQNDFFLLHGVTCTWSMCQIVPVLNREDSIRLLAELVVDIEAAYMSQNSPKLSGKLDTDLKVTSEIWSDLIQETLAEDRDEHVYKLVQVCHEQSKECGHCKPVFLQAAKSCLNNELQF